MDYYKEVQANIKSHMEKQEYMEARLLLLQELRMPYIPKEHEQVFQELLIQCERAMNKSEPRMLSAEEISTLLQGSDLEIAQACEQLAKHNVRDFLKDIQAVLLKEIHPLLRTNLLEILKQQQVNEEICLLYEGLEITCIPIYMESIDENPNIEMAIQRLEEYIGNDNPSFYQLAVESLIKEAYYRLPISIAEDEVPYLVSAVLRYVYEAFSQNDALEQLLEEKDLAKYTGYDLLLYTYEV